MGSARSFQKTMQEVTWPPEGNQVLACKEGAILASEEGEQERRDKALLLGLLRLRLHSRKEQGQKA